MYFNLCFDQSQQKNVHPLNIGYLIMGVPMLDDDNKNYFKTNLFLKILRFFNLLEPDRNILSISKIMMWSMMGVLFFVLMVMPDQFDAILTSGAAVIGSLMNYSFRRWMQTYNIKYKRTDDCDDDSDNYWRGRRFFGDKTDNDVPEYDIADRVEEKKE